MRVSGCGWRNIKGEHSFFLLCITSVYYQHDPTQLSICSLTIHALLHIGWDIRVASPVWTYWAFTMERHCNTLLWSIRSRCHPYTSISSFVTATAQLNQIQLLYDLHETLCLDPNQKKSTELIMICVGSVIHPLLVTHAKYKQIWTTFLLPPDNAKPYPQQYGTKFLLV